MMGEPQAHLNLLDRYLVIPPNERIAPESSDVGIDIPGEGIVVVDNQSETHLWRQINGALVFEGHWLLE